MPKVWLVQARPELSTKKSGDLVVVEDLRTTSGLSLNTEEAIEFAIALLSAAGARMTCEHVPQEAQADG